ncbi:exopolysaccharide Pel transporter PelG [Lederbergia citri]|uniref:Exopolysaccharide Pel transporter PelG n=1 Tax=Lederbergia citri TaxID=2833580 RepID=A0A942TGE3_9BACI|nr:exopolysaccharide Pel transporter PelG [Lederbergia citri]MBS4196423.1 exopolysaccharide Pel transporter PelG [Lederbergia citri]
MAGIGFQLKKLVGKEKFYGGLRAFVYSSVIISGPMILCIVQLLIGQKLLSLSGAELFERELLLSTTMYSFVFSQVITGGLLMVVTRYVSDQIYMNKEENVMSSLYGSIAIILVIGGSISTAFYSFSPLGTTFKIVAYLLFIELLITNILAIYISAVKKYMHIVKAYGFGAITSISAMGLCLKIFNTLKAEYFLVCMAAGFIIAIVLLIRSVKERFPKANKNYFDFLSYIQKYPSLFFIGLFYVISLFGHIFIVWSSDIQEKVGDTFVMAPLYDVPIFYAYLSIIPAMVMFVVSMETSFFEAYKKYYEKVSGEYSLGEISEARKKMFHVLTRELVYIMEFQLIFTILAIALGTTIIPLTIEQRAIFNVLVIGNYFFIIMFVLMQILLYFDDRKGAVIVISTFMSVSLLSMTVIVLFGGNYGLASFISGMIGLITAFLRLFHYVKNHEYYTFCSQPLFPVDKTSFMDRFAHRMNRLNGGERGN